MATMRPPVVVAALTLVAVLAIAGCGDSSSGGYGSGGESTKAASNETTGANVTVVSVAGVGDLGRVLVDSKGFTLYDFHKDKGGKSACYGPCASVWPPLTTGGAPKASGGAMATKLGTTERTDGTTQVTYAGHPLYTYQADVKPGDAKGNDFSSYGAEWYALQPSGEDAEG